MDRDDDPDSRAGERRRREPLEPGHEVGETREVGPGGGAEELAGRAPATKVVVHARKPSGRARDRERQD